MGRALLHGWNNVGGVVGLLIDSGAVSFEALRPATLVFQLPVQRFPALGFFLGIEQGKFSTLDYRNVRALRNLRHTKRMLGLFLHPLIAAHGGDAEDVEFVRLQKNQDGLLVAGAGTASVLVDDDLDSLGRRG